MKSRISHDAAGKPVDLSSATTEASAPGNIEQHENKRRRLIRGAVACAPLVLTLRSGALAAASCTAAKVVGVSTNNAGKFTPPSGSGVAPGDYCVSQVQACLQDTPSRIGGGTVDSVPISRVGNGNSAQFQCGVAGERTVAILSSGSVTSLSG